MTAHTRRFIAIIIASALISIIFVSSFRAQPFNPTTPKTQPDSQLSSPPTSNLDFSQATLSGHAIAPKLGNETAKAELGRATWKYFHTVFARFPDNPTPDESAALKQFIYLFQRLYPCGECASHFGEILAKFPPQVSSRSTAAAWACHVHNEVNLSLGKEVWDCANIGDFYDCGCAEDEKEEMKVASESLKHGHGHAGGKVIDGEMSQAEREKITGRNGRGPNWGLLPEVKAGKAGG